MTPARPPTLSLAPYNPQPIGQPNPLPPPGRIVRGILLGSALIGAGIAMILWVLILPIWLALLLRTIVSFGVRSAFDVFTRRAMADIRELEEAVALWPLGISVICATVAGHAPPPSPHTRDPWQLAVEAVFAIIFYAALIGWWRYGTVVMRALF